MGVGALVRFSWGRITSAPGRRGRRPLQQIWKRPSKLSHVPMTTHARRLSIGSGKLLRLPTGGSRRDRAASAYGAPNSMAVKEQVLRRRRFSRTMGP